MTLRAWFIIAAAIASGYVLDRRAGGRWSTWLVDQGRALASHGTITVTRGPGDYATDVPDASGTFRRR